MAEEQAAIEAERRRYAAARAAVSASYKKLYSPGGGGGEDGSDGGDGGSDGSDSEDDALFGGLGGGGGGAGADVHGAALERQLRQQAALEWAEEERAELR